MVVILGGLALYLSHLIARNYMATLTNTLSGQALLGAELLTEPVKTYYDITVKLDALPPTERPNDKHLRTVRNEIIKILTKINSPRTGALPAKGRNEIRISAVIRSTNHDIIAQSPPYAIIPRSEKDLPQTVLEQALYPEGERIGITTHFSEKYQEEQLFIAVPVGSQKANPAGVPVGILVLAAPTTNVRQTIGQIQGGILLAFIGGLLVLFLINAAVSIYISRPLNNLTQAAGDFSTGELHRRVQPTGAHEIASLGESFNSMAAQLESTIANLGEERAQAQAILASMFDGVMVTDPVGRILLLNQSLERLFDLRAEHVTGIPLAETIFHSELDELLLKTVETGLPLMHQVSFTQPAARTFEVHMAPVEVNGKLLGVVIALYDITNQLKSEQVRRDFVANVSHELRTPVASIRAMAETLADGGHEDREITETFLSNIIEESERLTAMLEGLLRLSQIESSRRLIAPEWIDLAELIRHVVKRLEALVAVKEQQVELEIPGSLPAFVDRDAMLQIILNLIDNARKYSPEGGGITVHAERVGDDRIRIKVTDTGIGIPEDEQDRIFERFYRVDKARSRTEGGAGLGLAIVKHLVELHGGWISVNSEVKRGSQFTVVLPQPYATTLPEEAGEPPSGDCPPITGSDA